MRLWLGVAAIVLCAAAFLVGRSTVGTHRILTRGSYDAGYLAGRDAAFGGFDGGWAYGAPYIVVLQRGGPGITYRVAHRIPMQSGVAYRRCGSQVCSSPARCSWSRGNLRTACSR
jgi:hypothetical protein